MRGAVPYRTIIEIEDPRVLLSRLALEQRADVIVVGSKGHSQVAALMLGSLASFLTQHAQVPVVVIPEGAALKRALSLTGRPAPARVTRPGSRRSERAAPVPTTTG